MVDSIGSSATQISSQRTLQTSRLRTTDILTAVQTQQDSGKAALKVFSVADAQKTGGINAKTKLPRGSLVDILA